MKKLFYTFLTGLLLLPALPAFAQTGDAEIELRSAVIAVTQNQEFAVDVMLKNPSRQKIISVRSWLNFDPAVLEAQSVDTKDTLFTLAAPGEDTASQSEGKVKIGRSNIEGGMAEAETKIATVRFKVKTASAVNTVISAYDYQVSELGHTSVNIIEQGFPLNILGGKPKDLSLIVNGGGTGTVVTVEPEPIGGGVIAPPVNLVRPTGLKINTGPGSVDLKWDNLADPNRAGFNVYYGKVSGQYTRRRTLTNVFSVHMDGFNNNETYYFAVTAYDSQNRESDYSDEVGVIINQPLSSTSPFEGVIEDLLRRIPSQPQNGPLASALLISAIAMSATILLRTKKQTN